MNKKALLIVAATGIVLIILLITTVYAMNTTPANVVSEAIGVHNMVSVQVIRG